MTRPRQQLAALSLWAIVLVLGAGLAWLLTANQQPVVTVRWSTASELNTAGFNLYRSASPEGPFVQANQALIPASPDPLIGGSYVFTDTQVIAGQTYYYQLEEVEVGGLTTRQGTIAVQADSGVWPLWVWLLIAGGGLLAVLAWQRFSRSGSADGSA